MRFLSRQEFIDLCTRAILKTRDVIAINNQLSGYVYYHREIKENNYLENTVRYLKGLARRDSFFYRHDVVEHAGLGNCHELADYLLIEIAKEIKAAGAEALLNIVSSLRFDHVYLEIKIVLDQEINYSRWEVDAWDPRIIDISMRPDGSIKNIESLNYGYKVELLESVCTRELPEHKSTAYRQFLSSFRKPQPGSPQGDRTPTHQMLEKHEDLYSDYPVEEAFATQKLPTQGTRGYLQHVSGWQLYPQHFFAPKQERTQEETSNMECQQGDYYVAQS